MGVPDAPGALPPAPRQPPEVVLRGTSAVALSDQVGVEPVHVGLAERGQLHPTQDRGSREIEAGVLRGLGFWASNWTKLRG